MSVSDKFYNFNKRPHFGGLYGKTLSSFKKWTVYTDCTNATVLILYTAISVPSLIVGVITYTDSGLSTPFTGSFSVAGNQYTVVTGSITLITSC